MERVSIFVDGANMYYAQKRLGWFIDYRKQRLRDRAACTKARFHSLQLTLSGRPAPPGRTPSRWVGEGIAFAYPIALQSAIFRTGSKPALETWKPRRGLV